MWLVFIIALSHIYLQTIDSTDLATSDRDSGMVSDTNCENNCELKKMLISFY